MYPLSVIVVTGIYQRVFFTKRNLLFVTWLMLASPALAVDAITLHIGRVTGLEWSAESLDIELDWQQEAAASYRMRVKEVTHPALSSPLKNLMITCQQGWVSDHKIACQQGVLQLQHPILDDAQIPIRFEWNTLRQKFEIELRELHFGSGLLTVTLQSNPEGWALNIAADALDMAAVYSQLAVYLPTMPDIELSGKADLIASASGIDQLLTGFQWHADLHDVAFSDASGAYLGDKLSAIWQGNFVSERKSWVGETALTLHQGELLSPYVYVGIGQQPLLINTQLSINPQQLQITKFHYDHPGILIFTSSATLLRQQELMLQQFQLQTALFSIQNIYEHYLLPTLAESIIANLEWEGQAKLALSTQSNGAQLLALKLDDVSVEESVEKIAETAGEDEINKPRRSFALYGVNGVLNWSSGQEPAGSTLTWEGGHFMEGVTLGRTELDLSLHENNITLLNPAMIPVLDGGLVLSTFDLTVDDAPRFIFGGALTPISMEAFSQAMDWLPLSGTLSGGIPKATYQNGTLALEGAMLVDLFEGQTIIQNLRVEDLLGVWPILNADIEFMNLDLEALTRTFSFGKITGKLEGQIDDLYLENWRPVSFNARFATPEQDESRHRISQRAIDNISNLGGSGLSGALSRGFLSFFEEFRYARLGVSCRLENGVCELDGVEAAEQGSYLVKGSGLPRVDIVGFNHQVDWELLINKLAEIAGTGVDNAEIE